MDIFYEQTSSSGWATTFHIAFLQTTETYTVFNLLETYFMAAPYKRALISTSNKRAGYFWKLNGNFQNLGIKHDARWIENITFKSENVFFIFWKVNGNFQNSRFDDDARCKSVIHRAYWIWIGISSESESESAIGISSGWYTNRLLHW